MGACVSKISSRAGLDSITIRLRGSGSRGVGARISSRMLISVSDESKPAITSTFLRDLRRLAEARLMMSLAAQKMRIQNVCRENRSRSAEGLLIHEKFLG